MKRLCFTLVEPMDASDKDIVMPEFWVSGRMRARMAPFGLCFQKEDAGRRYCRIYVQRTGDLVHTAWAFLHEMAHATIWLFHLPKSWDAFLDRYYVSRPLARRWWHRHHPESEWMP